MATFICEICERETEKEGLCAECEATFKEACDGHGRCCTPDEDAEDE